MTNLSRLGKDCGLQPQPKLLPNDLPQLESKPILGVRLSILTIRENWVVSKNGLDILSVQTLWKPRESDDLYVGTPAGLYVSRDGAETWQDTSLILQYPGVGREEIGGAAYIQAYWLGRYEGFIDEEEANRIWWK